MSYEEGDSETLHLIILLFLILLALYSHESWLLIAGLLLEWNGIPGESVSCDVLIWLWPVVPFLHMSDDAHLLEEFLNGKLQAIHPDLILHIWWNLRHLFLLWVVCFHRLFTLLHQLILVSKIGMCQLGVLVQRKLYYRIQHSYFVRELSLWVCWHC